MAAIRERLVREGIASAGSAHYAAHAREKRRGAVRGFEACLDLATPEQYRTVIGKLESECAAMRRSGMPTGAIREKRWELLQVEFVYEVLKAHWGISPQNARAAARYALVSEAASGKRKDA